MWIVIAVLAAVLVLAVPLVVVLMLHRGAGQPTATPTPGPTATGVATGPAATPTAGPGLSNPAAPGSGGTWRQLPPTDSPAAGLASVWAGTSLMIFSFTGDGTAMTEAGVAYDPVRDSWKRLPASPYPVVPSNGGQRAVWTGTEVLLFGMMNAGYDPATNRWRPLAAGPEGPSAVVWTGKQVLMWGGGCCGQFLATGSAYDPVTNSWQRMPAGPLAGRHANGVWTGTEMLVIGGTREGGPVTDAAAYNPSTRSWRRTAPPPSPPTGATQTWTGTELIVAGGTSWTGQNPVVLTDALAYNPATDQWRRLAAMPMPRDGHVGVWTGNRLLLWGGETTHTRPATVPPYGVSYDPVTDRWSPMPASPLKGRVSPIYAWTGKELIIWGGESVVPPWNQYTDGAAYRP